MNGWALLGGWTESKDALGWGTGYELRFEKHRIGVWKGTKPDGREHWGVVWTHKTMTLVEESGFATLNDCMTALWRHVFRMADEHMQLSIECAKRILGESK